VEVRRIDVGDWMVVRQLRLRALAEAPEAFGSSYEREAAFTDDVWIRRAAATTNATLVCENDDGEACGIVTLVRDPTDPRMAWLVGMWVAPSQRGTGAANLLVRTALEFAADRNITTVRLHIAEGNDRAERVYCRHGFSRTGARLEAGRPGLVEIEMERTTPG